MTEDEFRRLVLSFPDVEEGTSYGMAGYKLRGKGFTRLRSEDDSVVLRVGFDEREMLMEAEPDTFHLTPHYQNYPSVLARLSSVDPGTVKSFLERRWRQCAPKKLLKELDVGGA